MKRRTGSGLRGTNSIRNVRTQVIKHGAMGGKQPGWNVGVPAGKLRGNEDVEENLGSGPH